MSASITIAHNFETAHRLPFLPGKCTSLHGHSWWTEVTIAGELDVHGVLLDYGAVKRRVREWIDARLDHGTMLGREDPLIGPLTEAGCKLFVFDPTDPVSLCGEGRPLTWPTVENVAELLRRFVTGWLATSGGRGPFTVSVRVRETHVNEAVAA